MTHPLVAAARVCLGTPFHHQGRVAGVGCDCAGLVLIAARAIGHHPPDSEGYGRMPKDGLLRDAVEQYLVPAVDIAPGTVVLMQFETDVEPRHVAIVGDHPAGGLSLIHAYAPARRVVEHALDAAWQARIVALYTLPDLHA